LRRKGRGTAIWGDPNGLRGRQVKAYLGEVNRASLSACERLEREVEGEHREIRANGVKPKNLRMIRGEAVDSARPLAAKPRMDLDAIEAGADQKGRTRGSSDFTGRQRLDRLCFLRHRRRTPLVRHAAPSPSFERLLSECCTGRIRKSARRVFHCHRTSHSGRSLCWTIERRVLSASRVERAWPFLAPRLWGAVLPLLAPVEVNRIPFASY